MPPQQPDQEFDPQYELRLTKDGSYTIFSSQYQSTFHSAFGARTESSWIFIDHGIKHFQHSTVQLNILEIGLGSGMNALLTANYSQQNSLPVMYYAIEKHPLPSGIWTPYIRLSAQSEQEAFWWKKIHEMEWEKPIALHSYCSLHKLHLDLVLRPLDIPNGINLVYFDAFSPHAQNEMWTLETVKKVVDIMGKDSILVTYCVQGHFRRALKSLDLIIEKLPGPPGKREILKAVKNY